MRSRVRTFLSRSLIIVLILNGLTGFTFLPAVAQAQQKRVIVVNADQPNVWTLEQAHYLLAQMHRRNLDLRAKNLEDLDPNEINGLNFDALRQLIEVGVNFNQGDLASNRSSSRSQKVNAERRQLLLTRRDKLREESLSLTRDISQLQTEKARATSQEDKDRLDAEIASKTSLRDQVDKQVGFTNDELETLPAPSGELKATEAEIESDPEKLPRSAALDEAFKDAAKKQIEMFNMAPKLNATLRLENFLQMQYEIIAKQLTLLRDEVGPGERLLFLELPQTVNVTHHQANKKWAQSWWRIVGYTKKPKSQGQRTKQREQDADRDDLRTGNSQPVSTSEKVEEILGSSGAAARSVQKSENVQFVDLEVPQKFSTASRTLSIKDQSVRTVELIPRQSSLNVNDMKLSVKRGALSVVGSFLFGFGARLNVQRQREQFTQFVQQELYSSAFGKGSREFGWTFTPMPGTDRLLSGVRTTYAVVVAPEEATSLVVESNGCYFPRSAYQPNSFADTMGDEWYDENRTSRNCGKGKAFLVPIPVGISGKNDFWVKSISYQPVEKGQRIVVLISGSNFSAQIGALINGVSLPQSIGLAQPFLIDDSRAGEKVREGFKNEKVRGSIERVDANKIVLSFLMPDDFEGTPTITLVAPGRAIDLNWLDNVSINGNERATLLDHHENDCNKIPKPEYCVNIAARMFRGAPGPSALRIDSVDVFRNVSGQSLTAIITGAGFKEAHQLFINGIPVSASPVSPTLWRAEVSAPPDENIRVTLSTNENTITSKPIANPAFLSVRKVSIVSYEAASGKSPAFLVVKIEGSGFTNGMQASVSGEATIHELVIGSPTEAIVTIRNPGASEVVTLNDPRTNLSVKAVVTRKAPPKEEKAPR